MIPIPAKVRHSHPEVASSYHQGFTIVWLRATWSERDDLPGIRLPSAGGWLSVTMHSEWTLPGEVLPLESERSRAWAVLYCYRIRHLIAHWPEWGEEMGDRTVWVWEEGGALHWEDATV